MEKAVAEVAAKWWADKLRSCKQSGLSEEERKDPTNKSYEMAEMLMMLSKPKVTNEQINKFQDTLVSRILFSQPSFLDVDYYPDTILSDALLAAHIEEIMGTLPIKTCMWINDGRVSVRYGYGASDEQIYPSTKG